MKLSIAIPTRERAETLRSTLRTVLAIDDPDLEIVVSDNASTDDTPDLLAGIGDPRLRCVRTPRRVSQRQNFEHALSATTGDYAMIIGDDDAVLPGQWGFLRMLLAAHRPAAISWPALFYQWPAPHKRAGGGLLRLRRGLVYGAMLDRTAERQSRAITGLERTREDFSPKLYHGMVSRPVLEALRARTGAVVMSGQIDAYLSAALLSVLERYLYIRHPFTILAMGPNSGGSSVLEQFSGTANASLRQVAREAADDPVREALEGPFPSLGFYLLAGLEQARVHAFRGDFPLDHARYFDMILAQLAALPAEARARGIAILEPLARGQGSMAALEGAIAAHPARPAAVSANGAMGPLDGLIRRIESLSHLVPDRVTLDLKRRRDAADLPGSADHARLVADRLIGADWRGESDSSAAWRGLMRRAMHAMLFG